MAKGPNQRPDKGFIKELSKGTQPRKVEVNKFSYAKPVTPESKTTNGLATQHRIKEFKSVKENKTKFTEQHNVFVKKRRGQFDD